MVFGRASSRDANVRDAGSPPTPIPDRVMRRLFSRYLIIHMHQLVTIPGQFNAALISRLFAHRHLSCGNAHNKAIVKIGQPGQKRRKRQSAKGKPA
jgi:hypothetical protein